MSPTIPTTNELADADPSSNSITFTIMELAIILCCVCVCCICGYVILQKKKLKYTPTNTFDFGGNTSKTQTHDHEHGAPKTIQSSTTMSTPSTGDQVLITNSPSKQGINSGIVNIQITNITPTADLGADFDSVPPLPPSNSNLNAPERTHKYTSQSSEDSVDRLQRQYLSEEIDNAEHKIQSGNYKLTAGSFGSQLRATAGGPLSLSGVSMDGALPKTPDHSVSHAAPTFPSIPSERGMPVMIAMSHCIRDSISSYKMR